MAAYTVSCDGELSAEELQQLCGTFGTVERVTGRVAWFADVSAGENFRRSVDGVEAEGVGRVVVRRVRGGDIRNVTGKGLFFCDLCREGDLRSLDSHMREAHAFTVNPAGPFHLNDVNQPVLGKALLGVTTRDHLTRERWARCRQIPTDLTTIAAALYPGAKLIPFGSAQQYLGTTESDLDLCLRLPPGTVRDDVLSVMYDRLKAFFPLGSLMLVTTARIPIIKYTPPPMPYTPSSAVQLQGPDGAESCGESEAFVTAGTAEGYSYPAGYPWYPFGTAFDISLDPQGTVNTQLIRNYVTQCPVVEALCFLAKDFGKRTGIIDAKVGMLSSYAVTLLVLYYGLEVGLLTHVSTNETMEGEVLEEMVPWRERCLPTAEQLVEQWFGFLDYYHKHIKSRAVDLRDAPTALRGPESIKNWRVVQIIDPFEEGLNLARGIGCGRGEYVCDALCKELTAITTSYKGPDHYFQKIETEDTCANWMLLADSLHGRSDYHISERQALGIAAHTSPTDAQLAEVLLRLDASGTQYDVFPKVLACDPCNAVALFKRGLQLGKKGRNYFLEVLFHTTDSALCGAALGNVGLMTDSDAIVEVGGMAMSRRGVLCKAVGLDPMSTRLWKLLCKVVAEDTEGDTLVVGGATYTRAKLYANTIELQVNDGQIGTAAADELSYLASQLSQASETTDVCGKELTVPGALRAVFRLTGKPVPGGAAQFTSTRPSDELTARIAAVAGEPFIKAKLSHVDRVNALVACFDSSDQGAMEELSAIKERHPKLVVITV